MPTPSAFSEERRELILQPFRIGASQRAAAAMPGIGEATLRHWLAKGKVASEGTRFRQF